MTSLRSPTSDRRTVLAGFAAGLGAAGLAGCLDAASDQGTTENSSDDGSEENSDEGDAGGDSEENSSDDSPGDDSEEDSSEESSTEVHEDYESTEVRVTTPEGEELGEVTAAIADTSELQRLGLSDTEELPEDRGMLFVYDEPQDLAFAMPDMSFGIDIVFADSEGVITDIYHAPEPEPGEDGTEQAYVGYGQYVLEVVYEWTAERGVEEGDVLEFEL